MNMHKISWMFYAIEWGHPAEVFHPQKMMNSLQEKELGSIFQKTAWVAILHDCAESN